MAPLHAACLTGNLQICDALLDSGADFIKYDSKKFLPLHYAVVKDHISLLSYFAEKHKKNLLDP